MHAHLATVAVNNARRDGMSSMLVAQLAGPQLTEHDQQSEQPPDRCTYEALIRVLGADSLPNALPVRNEGK